MSATITALNWGLRGTAFSGAIVVFIITLVAFPAHSAEPIPLTARQRELLAAQRQNDLLATLDKSAFDTRTLYRMEYRLDAKVIADFVHDLRGYIDKVDATHYDLSRFHKENGVPPCAGASAILDIRNRSLVIINSGSNCSYLYTIWGPFFPFSYGKASAGTGN